MISCALPLLALPLTGCGSAGSSADASAHIELTSSAIKGTTLPALYTCDGKNIPPPVEWGAVPAGARELVLLVIGLTPAAEAGSYSASIEWAVAGINPSLHRLTPGRLPPGAYVGADSDNKHRYSICPKPGVNQRYQFQMYSMPPRLRVARDFVGMSVLGTLNQPNTSSSATGQGAFVVTYKRR
jgi:phosphatidylethanolamine-binding protein (PEBP) family uncharacterized protein